MTWAVSIFIVVDLPAPLGPSSPTQVPSGTSRSKPSTARMSPKRFTTDRRRIARFPMPDRLVMRVGQPVSAKLIARRARRRRRDSGAQLTAGRRRPPAGRQVKEARLPSHAAVLVAGEQDVAADDPARREIAHDGVGQP